MSKKRNFVEKRAEWLPKPIRTLLVADTPPTSGKYFYDGNNAFFTNILNGIFGEKSNKGLKEFQEEGYYLVESSEFGFGQELLLQSKKDFETFLGGLKKMGLTESTPIFLISKHSQLRLYNILMILGFSRLICTKFVGNGHQKDFKKQFARYTQNC